MQAQSSASKQLRVLLAINAIALGTIATLMLTGPLHRSYLPMALKDGEFEKGLANGCELVDRAVIRCPFWVQPVLK